MQLRDSHQKKSEKYILQELTNKKNGLITQDEAELIIEAVLKTEDIPVVKNHLYSEYS